MKMYGPALALIALIFFSPALAMGCDDSVAEAASDGLLKLRPKLPSLEEIPELSLARVNELIALARGWSQAQRGGKSKREACCFMPFYWPHKEGKVCPPPDCPCPQIFEPGEIGDDVSQIVIALIKRSRELGGT